MKEKTIQLTLLDVLHKMAIFYLSRLERYHIVGANAVDWLLRRVPGRVEGQRSLPGIKLDLRLLGSEVPLHCCGCVGDEFNLQEPVFVRLHVFNLGRVVTIPDCAPVSGGLAKYSIQRDGSIRCTDCQYAHRYEVHEGCLVSLIRRLVLPRSLSLKKLVKLPPETFLLSEGNAFHRTSLWRRQVTVESKTTTETGPTLVESGTGPCPT